MRDERLFNNNWEFLKLEFGTELADMRKMGDECWERVTLPHDWLIYDTLNLYADATGWYRKFINIEKETGRRYIINFDGVYMDSTVYVNGAEAGTHHYGYSAFEYDITELLKDGENEIVVQVRHKSPNTRWYSGAGIFRDVTFKNLPETHIATDGVYISPKKVAGRWVVITDTEVVGPDAERAALTYNIRLKPVNPGHASTISKPCRESVGFVIDDSSHGDNCAVCGHPCASRGTVHISDVETRGTTTTFAIDNPYVWDISSPNLYELRTSISVDGEEIDAVETTFGLREAVFTADRGLILNGRRVKLYGVCEHHDLGCLGSAFSKEAMRRKILILKDMGVNAIRTSHNMPARGLMELADEMGILIDSEAFDMWRRPKTTYDYARFFDTDCHEDVRSWVRRDRNRPSVIMWSIGNEIYDCHADESAVDVTAMLKSYVEEQDYLHNAPVTHGSNFMPWEGAQRCTEVLKLAGYNYGEKYYDEHHAKYPEWMIYGSETSSTVQSRGIYHFPFSASVMADDDEQCSTLGNCTTSWGAENVEYVIRADRDRDYAAGQFLWSGFDYIGEPTPYHTKNSYFGQIDTAGFPKDTYYIFKAEWTDVHTAPFVHVFPYWDFNEGQLIDIRVASNAPEVELIVNGVSMGRKSIDHEHGTVLCPNWQVPYHKGYIEAVAYAADGTEIARERRNSFGDVAQIKFRRFDFKGTDVDIEAAGPAGQNNAGQMTFYEIYAVDEAGNEVENADCRVRVSVENGTLLGLDNGDSTDFDQYKSASRRLFSGRLLAVVRADEDKTADDIVLTVVPDADDIPIRKLEIVVKDNAEGSCCRLDGAHRTVEAEAVICPEDASYDEIIWSAVNDYAVASNLAKIEADGRKVRITAMGDGDFRLRCMTHNGTDRIKCISSLEFHVEGVGTAYHDPYGFIAGSLYSDSKGDVGNGNEKGVATPRDSESYIGYDNIDFGEFGSDEITLPIFTLDGNEYVIQIWEGRPWEEGSELLCDGRYQKPSIWNVYQPETYRLKRRVKGVTSIYFTANAKYHLKGFGFTRPDKAYATVLATENSRIYGDTFTVEKDAVTGIGNNVTLEFDHMIFSTPTADGQKNVAAAGVQNAVAAGDGQKSVTADDVQNTAAADNRCATGLIICGSSPIENNSIHLKCTDIDTGEETTTLLEFGHSDGYEERTYTIPAITGNKRIGFVFLPGSCFDFKWFRFCSPDC